MSTESTAKRLLSTSPPSSAGPRPTSPPPAKKSKLEHPILDAILPPSPAPPATTPAALPPTQEIGNPPAKALNGKGKGKGRAKKGKPSKPGGAEETGYFDTVELLGKDTIEAMQAQEDVDWCGAAIVEWGIGPNGKEATVRVIGMSAHGDGLAILPSSSSTTPNRLVSIPFALPTELVKVHVHRHEPDPYYLSHADLIEIIEPSLEREFGRPEGNGKTISPELEETQRKFGSRVECKYFGVCSGCQYQPLDYSSQLVLKQQVIKKAFANFSGLPAEQIPEMGETLPSPKSWGYRTKLTPHFQAPPSGSGKGKKGEEKKEKEWEVTIGFEQKGRKRIVDIEECVIATKIINTTMVTERAHVKVNISNYKRGATLLLRDSLPPRSITSPTTEDSEEGHVCITDHHAIVRERVGNIELEQMAGSFFQNNSSILPSLISYIADALRGPLPVSHDLSTSAPKSAEDSLVTSTSALEDTVTIPNSSSPSTEVKPKKYLVDAYCGSGLFAIALADQFDFIEGVEIDRASVEWAIKNAEFNKGEGRGQVGFRAGSAEKIFGDINFPADQTTILIDPPRKGCDALFLTQLLNFYPATVVYVSCNVHTQARDVGWLVKESEKVKGQGKGYIIESVRAADLFPMTHHAEGVAILRRVV